MQLTRRGPGLLLRDLLRQSDPARADPQIDAVVAIIAEAAPDVLLLTGIDTDPQGHTARAVQALLKCAGNDLPHAFAPAQNAGLPTGYDMDGDGRSGGPRDAQGYGAFRGAGAMTLLSRFPIGPDTRDFASLLWAELPGATLPAHPGGGAFPDARTLAVQRLSSTGHWVVPVMTPAGALPVLAYYATPPVFDGPEDRNGLRNADETRFWTAFLNGTYGPTPPNFILLGGANLDPVDGEGLHHVMRDLLAHPALHDPQPASTGGAAAGAAERSAPAQRGPPALDTADWQDSPGPGNLRVDYVLPSAGLKVAGAGVIWPAPDDGFGKVSAERVTLASTHRLVWVDIEWPPLANAGRKRPPPQGKAVPRAQRPSRADAWTARKDPPAPRFEASRHRPECPP